MTDRPGGNPAPPPGWDELPPEMLEGAGAIRVLYLCYLAKGFSAWEASQIIGAMLAAQFSTQQNSAGQ